MLIDSQKREIINKIKWLCYDVYITTDNQVFNLDFKPRKEILNGGSYGYFVNRKFRSKKWINNHCTNIENYIEL